MHDRGKGWRPDSGLREAAEAALWHLHGVSAEHAEFLFLVDRMSALRHVAQLVRLETGADVSMVAPVEGPEQIVLRFVSGARGASLLDVVVPAGLGLGGRVLNSLRAAAVDDYFTAPSITHHFDAPVRGEGLHALAAVPIITSGKVAAVIYGALRREGSTFGDVALDTMERISERAALALTVQDRMAAATEVRVSDERRRTAVALHDSVGAMLFGIGAEVHHLRTREICSPGMTERLTHLEDRLAEASAALRQALAALNEAPAEHALATAVQGDCRAFEERTGIKVSVIVLGDVPELKQSRQQVLHRMVRETLLNVEKHARATSVVVSLGVVDDGVTLVVSDDGVGCGADEDSLPGIGLRSLQDSLAQVGGSLTVIANQGEGTTVRGWVPCL